MFDVLAGRARVGIAIAVLIVPSYGTAADARPPFEILERDAWQKPGEVVGLLQLWPGNVVGAIGAGTEPLEPLLANGVGATGRVLALGIEPHTVADLQRRVTKAGLTNVTVERLPARDPGLADGSVDRLLVINSWQQLPDRARYAAALNRALRPGGFVAVVDFTAESPKGPPARARVSPAAVVADLQAGGFSARTVPESLPLQYVVIGQKPAASTGRPAPTARQQALVDLIRSNADRARFTGGVNTYTVDTLQTALAPTDDPELRALLFHDDPVVTRTAAFAFAARGDRGLAVLREVGVDVDLPASNRAIVDDVIWTANARHAAAMGARRYGNPRLQRNRAPQPSRGAATALDDD
ncbi:MAG: methyltransferase domain-containing protein [Pseudomonadota bacterium]